MFIVCSQNNLMANWQCSSCLVSQIKHAYIYIEFQQSLAVFRVAGPQAIAELFMQIFCGTEESRDMSGPGSDEPAAIAVVYM